MTRIRKIAGDAAIAVLAVVITAAGAFFYASMGVRMAARRMRDWWEQDPPDVNRFAGREVREDYL